jgi:hypothetical protein
VDQGYSAINQPLSGTTEDVNDEAGKGGYSVIKKSISMRENS